MFYVVGGTGRDIEALLSHHLIEANLHRRCWSIETMFRKFKPDGFNLESSRLKSIEACQAFCLVIDCDGSHHGCFLFVKRKQINSQEESFPQGA